MLRQIAFERGVELSLILASPVSADGEEDGEGVRAVRRGRDLGEENELLFFPRKR